MKRSMQVLCLSLAACGVHAFAGHHAGSFNLSPMIGYYGFSSSENVSSKAIPSVSFGYDATDNLGIEVLVGGLRSTRKDVDARGVKVALGNVDGVYHFNTASVFEPYALAGVGFNFQSPNGVITMTNPNGDRAYTQTSLNAGGGVDYFLDNRAAIRGDVRDVYTINGGLHNVMASVGLRFMLDKTV